MDEGTLVRLLDGAAGAPERRQAETHLRGCAACRAALAELHARSAQVRHALDAAFGELPVPTLALARGAPTARRAPPRLGQLTWRAAAAVALGAGALAAMSPSLRARVARLVPALDGGMRDGRRPVTPVPPRATPDPREGARTERVLAAFAPAGERLRVEITGDALTGALVVEVRDTSAAILATTHAEVSSQIVVLPGALRVHTPGAVDPQLHLIVPARLRELDVRVGDVSRLRMAPATRTTATTVRVPLGRAP